MTKSQMLLQWTKELVASSPIYAAKGVHIRNWHTAWKDGLAFCALIHATNPSLINWDSLDAGNAHANLSLAFSVAQRDLGVAKLLDAEDIIDMARPDAKSIQTYVLVLKKALVGDDSQDSHDAPPQSLESGGTTVSAPPRTSRAAVSFAPILSMPTKGGEAGAGAGDGEEEGGQYPPINNVNSYDSPAANYDSPGGGKGGKMAKAFAARVAAPPSSASTPVAPRTPTASEEPGDEVDQLVTQLLQARAAAGSNRMNRGVSQYHRNATPKSARASRKKTSFITALKQSQSARKAERPETGF